MGKKDAFLGMPHGTAINRLRKRILFKYVQLAGHDVCFKCREKIETIDSFTIEHKLPWENRESGQELFWDLDNIAFSHAHCNIPHIRKNGRSEAFYARPQGTQWCGMHEDYLPEEMFWKNPSKSNGLETLCKEHKYAYDKSKRKNHSTSMKPSF